MPQSFGNRTLMRLLSGKPLRVQPDRRWSFEVAMVMLLVMFLIRTMADR